MTLSWQCHGAYHEERECPLETATSRVYDGQLECTVWYIEARMRNDLPRGAMRTIVGGEPRRCS